LKMNWINWINWRPSMHAFEDTVSLSISVMTI